MDPVGKRQLVVICIVIVQALKISDLLQINHGKLSGPFLFLKWNIIEILLILAIWIARIPRLIVRTRNIFLIKLGVILLNLLIFFGLPIFIRNMAILFRLEAQASERPSKFLSEVEIESIDNIAGSGDKLFRGNNHLLVRLNHSYYIDLREENHLQGIYTVKLQSWSSVRFGRESLNLCIRDSSPMPNSSGLPVSLQRPVLANAPKPTVSLAINALGMGPWKAVITRNSVFFREVTIPKSGALTLPVDSPGTYALIKAVDGQGKLANVDGLPSVVIEPCPELRFDGLLIEQPINICPSSNITLKLWIKSGRAPYSALLEVIVKSEVRPIYLEDIQPSSSSSKKYESHESFLSYTYNLDVVKIISGETLITDFLLRVASVTDRNGISHHYGDWDVGDSISFHVFKVPTVRWVHSKAIFPKDATEVELSVIMTGNSPIALTIRPPHGGEDIIVKGKVKEKVRIPHPTSGSYELVKVEDSQCQGRVLQKSILELKMALEPVMDIKMIPLVGECKDHVEGVYLDLTYQGEAPPWELHLQEIFTGSQRSKPIENLMKVTASSPFHRYTWKPRRPGEYHVKAIRIFDSVYVDGRPLDFSFKQTVLPIPEAAFDHRWSESNGIGCRGQAANIQIPINLNGIPPWTLHYNITSSHDGRSEAFAKICPSDQTSLTFDFSDKGGDFVVLLTSIEDSTGCRANIYQQSRKLKIFENAPLAFFSKDSFTLRKGMNDVVPLTLRPNTLPINLELQFTPDADGGKITSQKYTFESLDVVGIKLPEMNGTWKIVDGQDKFCRFLDTTKLPSQCCVTVAHPPNVSFVSHTPKLTTCNQYEPVKVKLSGNGAVQLAYYVSYGLTREIAEASKGELKTMRGSKEEIVALMNQASSPPLPGFYQFELFSLSDELYPASRIANMKVLQQVLPEPQPAISFMDVNETLCIDEHLADVGPIRLEFLGSEIIGNFPVTLEIIVEGPQFRKIVNVKVHQDLFFTITNINPLPGVYYFRLKSLKTSLGAVWYWDEGSLSSNLLEDIKNGLVLMASLLQRPSFTIKSHNQYFCVGDVVYFRFSGSGPYGLKYSHAGQKPKFDKTALQTMNILLAEAGDFHVISLCNDYCCARSETVGALEKKSPDSFTVYPLPTAQLHSGSTAISEGELSKLNVHLRGTPPFTYGIGRINEMGDIIESSIFQARTNDHSMEISKNGTYKVIYVKDSFCDYPRWHSKELALAAESAKP